MAWLPTCMISVMQGREFAVTDPSQRQTRVRFAGLAFLAVPGFLFAQSQTGGPPPPDPQPQSSTAGGGWRSVDEVPPNPAEGTPGAGLRSTRHIRRAGHWINMGSPCERPADDGRAAGPDGGSTTVDAEPGTFVTVRVDQPLSSDRNQQGDAFIATLARPVVVDGVVVAERGQTLSGRVVEAQKAGRAKAFPGSRYS